MRATTPPVLPALGDIQEVAGQDEFLSVRTLAAGAEQINTTLNLGLSDLDLYTWFAYADHTGEQAVKNVLKDQGRRR